MKEFRIKHSPLRYRSRRRLLTSGLAICAGSLLDGKPSMANDMPTALQWKTVPSAAIADPAHMQAVLANFGAAAKQQKRIKSLVVSQNQQTLLAESLSGPAVDRTVNIKSISKSVVATLLGVAHQLSVIDSLEQTLGELAPELLPKGASKRVADLTLEDLVTMRAGLERTSGKAYGSWVNSDNWIHHVLSRPFVDVPGGRMLYSTGDSHVLGAVLSQLTGLSLHELANNWLGKPLGIYFAPWTRDPQGYFLGGNEMAMSPLHLVKLGELYVANGVMNGRKLLDESWILDAFTPHTQSVYSGDGYGYGWFLRELSGVPTAYARGYGGQVLYVLPGMSLAIAITSDETQRAPSNGYMGVLHDLVAKKLIAPLVSNQ